MKITSGKSTASPLAVALLALAALMFWWSRGTDKSLRVRVPGTDLPPGAEAGATNPVVTGRVIRGDGLPANLPGAWPSFQGSNRDGISTETGALAKNWDSAGPREIWQTEVGEGYAGAAVFGGRVFVMDYVHDKRQSALRCLSLADGREIWRYSYPLSVKRNHGMTRTVPAVTEKFVVAIDPKCNVVCVETASGELKWGLGMVREFGATVPPWYTGQCPLLDGKAVILAPGGRDALLVAVDFETGKVLWQTPNPRGWKMTHSSVMPMEFAGRRMFVYCGSGGVVGVSAKDGALLWETSDWKISIATVPSPLVLEDGKIFLSGGYNAGAMMLQLRDKSGKLTPHVLFKLTPEIFGATQHTPIYRGGHIFGVRPDGQFVCLDVSGKVVWASGPSQQFGLGPFTMAGDLVYAMDGNGKLSLLEASATRFNVFAQAQVLKGRESWAPMALTGGRLMVRDLTRMVCLDVRGR